MSEKQSKRKRSSPPKSEEFPKPSASTYEEIPVESRRKGNPSKEHNKHDNRQSNSSIKHRPIEEATGEHELSIKFDEILDSLLKTTHAQTPIEMPNNGGNRSPPNTLHLKPPKMGRHEQLSETIQSNTCLIISGSPNYVKSIEILRVLYEEGYARDQMIGVSEPRKEDSISMSHLLSYHMNLTEGEISYAAGSSPATSSPTRINYMIDELFLKEIRMDPMLWKYGVVVLVEAQERSIFSDILLGFLTCIAQRRSQLNAKLKLIVMSESKDVNQFWRKNRDLSEKPLHIMLDSPVPRIHLHYTNTNGDSAWKAAYERICDVHQRWPKGNILVFVTEKDEVMTVCRKLNERFSTSSSSEREDLQISTKTISEKLSSKPKRIRREVLKAGCSHYGGSSSRDDGSKRSSSRLPSLHIVPIFSPCRLDQQRKIFENTPKGTRLCVVATDISEMLLSLPNMTYVIDSGKLKGNTYDASTGIFSSVTSWISKSAADKRSGFTEENGHCFRLYTSEAHSILMPRENSLDIHKKPIDDIVLTLASLQIPLLRFPCNQIQSSVGRLALLEALEEKRNASNERSLYITRLGQMMLDLPVSPRFAKMIIKSFDYGALITYVVLVVCGLSIEDSIVQFGQDIELPGDSQSWLLGEIMTMLIVIIGAINKVDRVVDSKQTIRPRALQDFHQLRCQLLNKISDMHPYLNVEFDSYLKLPNNEEIEMIRLVVFSGSVWNIAKLISEQEQTLDSPLVNQSYRMMNSIEPAFLHPNSPYATEYPTWIMYQQAYRNEKNGRIYLKGVSVIDPTWLYEYAPSMCVLSEPLQEPAARYDPNIDRVMCHRSATFGNHEWCLPPVEKPYPVCHEVYVWTAYYFLDGALCPQLKKFRHLIHDPEVLLRPDKTNFERRSHDIIRAFETQDCYSYGHLLAIWELKPLYLLKEYQLWFQKESLKPLVQNMWPKLRNME